MDPKTAARIQEQIDRDKSIVKSEQDKAPYLDSLPQVTRQKISKYFWKLKATHPRMSMERLWRKTGEKFKIKFEIE